MYCLFLFCLGVVSCLEVSSPSSYQGLYPHNKAPFGSDLSVPVQGVVAFAAPENACTKLLHDYSGFLVLAIRGNCSAVEKAYHVMNAGGTALILGNDLLAEIQLPVYDSLD